MKRFLEPAFIEGVLIFFVIQPLIFFIGVGVFLHSIYESILG